MPVVLASVDDADVLDGYARFQRDLDDMEWLGRIWSLAFTWQTWVDWFAARRWIMPDGALAESDHLRPQLRYAAPGDEAQSTA